MNLYDAIRFLDYEARQCRDKDMHEALCLLLPAMMRALALKKMDCFEALDFRVELRESLKEKVEELTT